MVTCINHEKEKGTTSYNQVFISTMKFIKYVRKKIVWIIAFLYTNMHICFHKFFFKFSRFSFLSGFFPFLFFLSFIQQKVLKRRLKLFLEISTLESFYFLIASVWELVSFSKASFCSFSIRSNDWHCAANLKNKSQERIKEK